MVSNEYKEYYISFIIDDKTYAAPISSIEKVVENPNIMLIAGKSESLVGLFNMNNFNVPVFDLRLLFNENDVLKPIKTCLLVASVAFKGQEKIIGFIVDSAHKIYHIQADDLVKIPAYSKNEYIEAVFNIDEKLIMILSIDNIIKQPENLYFLNRFWNAREYISQGNKYGGGYGNE